MLGLARMACFRFKQSDLVIEVPMSECITELSDHLVIPDAFA